MAGSMMVVEPFAGPGGWDIAATALGFDPIGIELDNDTCITRTAAGLTTIRADVSTYQLPANLKLDGLIASPPCPAFSMAGTGSGRAEIDAMCQAIETGRHVDDTFSIDSQLVALPLVWALRHRPTWIALEQVPPVLPIWETVAHVLRQEGWNTWVGILCAADYGVPQQRYRAFLLAHQQKPVHPPAATHTEHPQPTLFGDELKPWVTMAQALNLPSHMRIDSGQDSGPTRARYYRDIDRPASTLTSKSPGQWILEQYGGSNHRPARTINQPAPTITTKVNRWIFERPATTITGTPKVWPPGHKLNRHDIARLGKTEAEARYGDRKGTNAIKISIDQAATLQTFPTGYPFHGTKTSQAKQIGNAVPPQQAHHILTTLTANP